MKTQSITVYCRRCGCPFTAARVIHTRGRYCTECKKDDAKKERAAARAAMAPLERVGFRSVPTEAQATRIRTGKGTLRDRLGTPVKRTNG